MWVDLQTSDSVQRLKMSSDELLMDKVFLHYIKVLLFFITFPHLFAAKTMTSISVLSPLLKALEASLSVQSPTLSITFVSRYVTDCRR